MVRKESADTQEYESFQLNDTDEYMDEDKEELSFVPREGFNCFDIAPKTVAAATASSGTCG